VIIRPPAFWKLTRAEARVVERLAHGLRPVEIAIELGLSIHTIRTQLKRAMAKADIHTQAGLVATVYSAKSHGN
jgi:DNA-binding CsgD family transcriptional regulator